MSELVTVWATIASCFTAVALYRLWRARRVEPSTGNRRRPHVLLIRPVDSPTARSPHSASG